MRWRSRVELTASTSATNYFNRPFQALSENVFIRIDIAFSTLDTFCLMGYISLPSYLLKLLLSANRKSYTPCRLAQQWMTLNDLGWPNEIAYKMILKKLNAI